MIHFIYSIPNLFLFLLIFLFMSVISIFCLYIIRKYVPLKLRYKENESIEYVGATIGVVYAVLAGFIILYVMNNFEKASDTASREATGIATLFRDADSIPEPLRSQIQNDMNLYANTVIKVEWPNMSTDQNSYEGEQILDQLHDKVTQFKPSNEQEILAVQTLLENFDILYSDRSQRFDVSKTALNGDLWILLLISTFLTLFINCLIGMEFRLHLALQIVVTLMVSAIFFLIIVLDRPFLGYFSIQPQAFEASLVEMNNNIK